MKSKTPSADDLIFLADIIDAGGFTSAQERTGASKSMLSRRIRSLEEELGVVLLVRSSRHFEPTEVGQRMYAVGAALRAEVKTALAVASEGSGEPSGVLRVSSPVALAAAYVIPLSIEFAHLYPRLTIDIVTTDGRSSASGTTADIFLQPVRSALNDSEMVARKLVDVHYSLAASPELAKRFCNATSPQDLKGAPAIGWNFDDDPTTWTLHNAQCDQQQVVLDVRLHIDDLQNVYQAGTKGIGIAQFPTAMIFSSGGLLVPVLPGWLPSPIAIYALYPSRRHLTLGGRLFLDALATRLCHLASCHPPA